MLMRKIAFAVLSVATLGLSGCSGPSYFWIVNGTSHVLTITSAGGEGSGRDNAANASPWFWPWRTNPVIRPGGAYRLTSYCYGCSPGWRFSVEVDECAAEIVVPEPPNDAYESETWRPMFAYRDAAVQIEDDLRVYRVPAYAGDPIHTELIPQPEGYPISADRGANCSKFEAPI